MLSKFSPVEWSGILFFKATGSILKPETLKIKCQHFIPMDVGTSGYTEFEYDAGFTTYVVQHDLDADGWRQGKLH